MDRPGIYARVGVRPAEEERPEERQPTERRPSSEFQDGARAPLHAVLHGSKEDDQEVAVLSHGCQHSEHFLLASWRDVGPKAMLSVDERSASSTPCCAARLKGRRPRGGCALARLPALRAFLCWRAGEIWARRPCSVLLSGSASSTPCGGCCDLQAVLEPIGRCWASCVARVQIC